VYHHDWTNYATQFNWGLDNCEIATAWTMRMDADERITPELATEINQTLRDMPSSVTGFLIKRRVYFWGKWIRHGAYYPTWLLRLWRTGKGRCEQRSMDEHIVVEGGDIQRLQADIIDENHKGLDFWINKHNSYASREAFDLLAHPKRVVRGFSPRPGRAKALAQEERLLQNTEVPTCALVLGVSLLPPVRLSGR
jgi:hypothetical protein